MSILSYKYHKQFELAKIY